jgi:tetratricopeptide (TPR) repeat protein
MSGDLERARKEHGTALKLADGEEYLVGFVRHGMGEVDVLGGDWAAARKHFEIALKHRVSYGELSSEADTRLALGRLTWWEGDLEAAEVQVRRAVKELEQAEVPLQQALALLTLAEILADAGDPSGAMEALAQGRELGAAADNPRVRFAVILTQARLRPEAPGLPQQLPQARSEAGALGMEPLALEGRLLEAISAQRRGESAAAQDIASGLEEAKRRGWMGLARRAQRWLDRPGDAE